MFMKKKTLLLPLARQFAIILVLFILCTVGITGVTTYEYAKLQTSFADNSLESYSSQLARNTREAYESCENICYNIAYSQSVQNYLLSRNADTDYAYYEPLMNQLRNAPLLNSFITDIAVYGENGCLPFRPLGQL